jgi:hypothetical protein
LLQWVSTGEAGTSSSRGKAITHRRMCTFIATAKLIVKWDLDNQKPMKGAGDAAHSRIDQRSGG